MLPLAEVSHFLPFFLLKAVDLAQTYTRESDNITAVNSFKAVLRDTDMFFNSQPFPASESGNAAFLKCHNTKSAQEHCPERWKAMQEWIKNTVEVR